jgi:hypothetical protein
MSDADRCFVKLFLLYNDTPMHIAVYRRNIVILESNRFFPHPSSFPSGKFKHKYTGKRDKDFPASPPDRRFDSLHRSLPPIVPFRLRRSRGNFGAPREQRTLHRALFSSRNATWRVDRSKRGRRRLIAKRSVAERSRLILSRAYIRGRLERGRGGGGEGRGGKRSVATRTTHTRRGESAGGAE